MITLHKTKSTQTREHWLIEHNGIVKTTITTKNANRRGIDNLRYIICRTLKINANQFRFIGNRRIQGKWITEWVMI